MIPTMKFRWLELPKDWIDRQTQIRKQHPAAIDMYGGRVRVLQQWWEDELPTIVAHGTDYVETERKGEWRDIPVEEQA